MTILSKHSLVNFFAAILSFGASMAADRAIQAAEPSPRPEIGFVRIDQDITLRRMVVRGAAPKGTVLLLHGFPETLHAWTAVSQELAADYEVHAFDWPGFGLSSRPAPERFAYAPKDYARVLRDYIRKAGIDRSTLTIYATDIGALPALLLALDEPDIARRIIVGDFAPFDRPAHLYASLQNLKMPATAEQTRAYMNKTSDEILENASRRGLPVEAQFELPAVFKDDMARGWTHGGMTSADAFAHYYSHFTRDQNDFEARLATLRTPVKVMWGEKDFYINQAMGAEFAQRTQAAFTVLPGVGHYPHLQAPQQAVAEIRASFK